MEKESQKDALIYDLRGVDYTFAGKFTALRFIDLKVRTGERLAIVGANGCGKSTLLHIWAGCFFPRMERSLPMAVA